MASRWTMSSPPSWPPCPCRADGWRSPGGLSCWPCPGSCRSSCSPRLGTVLLWVGVLALACVLDLALAAPPRAVEICRTVPGSVRLGQDTSAELLLSNTSTRTLRALVRDCWQPSRARSPASASSFPVVEAGAGWPWRCGPPGAATCPPRTPPCAVRPARPGRPPADHRRAGHAAGAAAVQFPAASARQAAPIARAGRQGRRPDPRGRDRVRLAARLCPGRRRALDRLAGHGPAP